MSAIYPSELELKGTSTSSTGVCYLDTNIKTGDNTHFRISIYDKREDFAFRIVNFPYMDSNIPANPAYGVYISQLVRYARICTSKVDFINRLRGLSLRLRQQGFETNLLQKSFNKFFSLHGLIVEKYDAAQAVCVTTHKGSWVRLFMCLISIVTRSSSHLVREREIKTRDQNTASFSEKNYGRERFGEF